MKRSLDMIVLSGINLGNNAQEVDTLQHYLDSVSPKAIVINGNFIKHRLHSNAQVGIIETLTRMAEEGTRIYFIANNVPLALQAYPEFFHRNIYFEQNLTLRMKGKKYLFFNDNFTQKHLAIKYSPISAKAFADKALEIALKENADYIVCGHNCSPQMKLADSPNRRIIYLHAGSWQNHLSALEYNWGCWSLYEHQKEQVSIYPSSYGVDDIIWGTSNASVIEKTLVTPYY